MYAYTLAIQLLEKLIIPNCKKIPNKTLCDVLQQNPSLLFLDISNKMNPRVDVSVVNTLAHHCRFLRVLKLSDFRVEDPKCLLVLCGKVIVPDSVAVPKVEHLVQKSDHNNTHLVKRTPERDLSTEGELSSVSILGSDVVLDGVQISSLQDSLKSKSTAVSALTHNTIIFHHNRLSSQGLSQSSHYERSNDVVGGIPMDTNGCSNQNQSPMEHQDVSTLMEQLLAVESSTTHNEKAIDLVCPSQDENQAAMFLVDSELESRHNPIGQNNYDKKDYHTLCQSDCWGDVQVVPSAHCLVAASNVHRFPTREEHENQLARREKDNSDARSGSSSDADEGDSDEDLYEDDDPVVLPLSIEDRSSEFGCLELETLWLDNVNLNDQVCAVLLQSLPNLRDLNLSDTDICNPWRLLDPTQSTHLRLLKNLDVKSTALSRTALEMIPKFHPDLHMFSISSTTLPPHTYANIGKLTGVANLELIGGQFYPCPPAEIFEKGIAPAVSAIGIHLQSLNLTYIAHVDFEVISLNCPSIEHLDLSSAYISVSYPCVSLGDSCPHLISLNLGSSHIDAKEDAGGNSHPVSAEKALEKMLGQPRVLEDLDLSGLTLTDETVESIFPQSLHPLCTINLSRCHKVTIAGVQHVWQQCPNLRSIDIKHCREITVSDFQNFEKSCHHNRPMFKQEGKLDWV